MQVIANVVSLFSTYTPTKNIVLHVFYLFLSVKSVHLIRQHI